MILNIYLVLVNIISFFLYYIDKKKSIKRKYRIKEKVLLGFSLIGGVFGSVLSMVLFHHKTKHIKFIIVNTICIIMWLLCLMKDYI